MPGFVCKRRSRWRRVAQTAGFQALAEIQKTLKTSNERDVYQFLSALGELKDARALAILLSMHDPAGADQGLF